MNLGRLVKISVLVSHDARLLGYQGGM